MTTKRLGRMSAPRQYTEGEFALKRAEAKALFLAGRNPQEIDQILELRKGRARYWAQKYDWISDRDKVTTQITENRLQSLLQQQEETFRELKIIRDKSIDAISTDEVVPRKFAEAASAYLNTVEVERKLKTEALQISFITDVARVLREKIQDKDLLFEIAEGLKEVFNRYQSKTLGADDRVVSE